MEERILLVTIICSTWLCCTLASDVKNGVRCSPEVPNRRACWSGLLAQSSSSASPGAHGGAERKRRTAGPDWGARCPWKKGVANTDILPLFILPPVVLKGLVCICELSCFSSSSLNNSHLLACRSQHHFQFLENGGTWIPTPTPTPVTRPHTSPPLFLLEPLNVRSSIDTEV